MKATIDTKELRGAVTKVNYISRKGNSLPITQTDVQMVFDGEYALLTSTDLERVIKIKVKAKSTEPFIAVLNRNSLLKFLQGGNNNTTITAKKSDDIILEREDIGKLRLETNKHTDFPPMPTDTNLKWVEYDTKWLLRYIDYAIPACVKDNHSRPILTGIVFKNGAMASADGFRLVSIKDDKLTFNTEVGIIVPLDTILFLKRLFKKTETINIGFNDARIHFTSGNTTLISQLIQGNFPQYEQLIPEKSVSKVTLSSPLLIQRLNMIDPTQISNGIVRYIFQAKQSGQVCIMKSGVEDYASYELSLPSKIKGKDNKIAINHRYMLDAIKPFSLVNIELNSMEQPIKVTGDIEELTVVIMPMYVQWD